MLDGIDPIFLFNFFKLTPELKASISKIPVVDSIVDAIGLPPIPLYLSERLTGICVSAESKNIDVQTDVETNKDATDPKVTQKPIGSTITIQLVASAGSLGLTILSAMMDVILPKLTSREYSITYLHGPITVFNGQLQSFAINQSTDNDMRTVVITLVRSSAKAAVPVANSIPAVSKVTAAVPAL